MARNTRKTIARQGRRHRMDCPCGPCRCNRTYTSLKQMQRQALKGT